MSWWYGVLLGIIQGLTEFLPVSSSGHLALAQMLIPGFHQPGVIFDALLHTGTAAAILYSERAWVWRVVTFRESWRLPLLLALGTIATGLVALPIRGLAEGAFESALAVGVALLITTALLVANRWLPGGAHDRDGTTWRQAVVVGAIQGLTVFPGISRSGTTITAGLALGLSRDWVARFSFLLSVPAILGVTAVELVLQREELAIAGASFWLPAVAGMLAAALTGYVALRLVIRVVASRVFHRFSWYTLPLGLLVVALALWGGW